MVVRLRQNKNALNSYISAQTEFMFHKNTVTSAVLGFSWVCDSTSIELSDVWFFCVLADVKPLCNFKKWQNFNRKLPAPPTGMKELPTKQCKLLTYKRSWEDSSSRCGAERKKLRHGEGMLTFSDWFWGVGGRVRAKRRYKDILYREPYKTQMTSAHNLKNQKQTGNKGNVVLKKSSLLSDGASTKREWGSRPGDPWLTPRLQMLGCLFGSQDWQRQGLVSEGFLGLGLNRKSLAPNQTSAPIRSKASASEQEVQTLIANNIPNHLSVFTLHFTSFLPAENWKCLQRNNKLYLRVRLLSYYHDESFRSQFKIILTLK